MSTYEQIFSIDFSSDDPFSQFPNRTLRLRQKFDCFLECNKELDCTLLIISSQECQLYYGSTLKYFTNSTPVDKNIWRRKINGFL